MLFPNALSAQRDPLATVLQSRKPLSCSLEQSGFSSHVFLWRANNGPCSHSLSRLAAAFKGPQVLFTALTNHIGRRGRNQEALHTRQSGTVCLTLARLSACKHVYRHKHRTSSGHPHARAASPVHRLAHTHPPLSDCDCLFWLPVLQSQKECSDGCRAGRLCQDVDSHELQ